MTSKPLTIGRLAKKAEINIETVRYYQRIGIINEPPKPVQGYRVYPSESIDRLHFIKRAKRLGFSLQEVAELLQLGDGRCEDVRHRAEDKLTTIEQQINDLKQLSNTLKVLISTCQTGTNNVHCPIVKALTKS